METKSKITLTIDAGVISEIKDKGLNISGICENALREILHAYKETQNPFTCKHKWTWAFCTPYGLAKECVKCRTIKKVKI